MEQAKLNTTIVKYGTAGVLRYRAMSGIQHDNQIPEIYLGGFIASGIHDELGLHAHVERLYTVIGKEHGIDLSAEIVAALATYRFEGGLLTA